MITMNPKSFLYSLILLVGSFALGGCATGSAIITGQQRTPISPDQVRIYSTPPQKPYEEIAIISANSYWSWAWNEQAKMNTVTREIREKAAALGANGVIVKSLGSEASGAATMNFGSGLYGTSMNNIKTVDGVAIYVP